MTLGSHLASPTVVRTAAGTLFVARLRLSDYALLLTAAADAIGEDDDSGVGVEFGDERTTAWLFSAGLPLLLWCALRRGRPGLTVDDAAGLSLTPDDTANVVRAAFRRSRADATGGGVKVDVAKADWGGLIWWFFDKQHALPPEVGELTLDQVHNLMSKGEDGSSRAGQAEMQSRWVEMMRERAAAGVVGGSVAMPVPGDLPGLTPVTVASLGYRVVEDDEQREAGSDG